MINLYFSIAVHVAASSKQLCFPGNINNENLELTGSHGTIQSPQAKISGWYPPNSLCDWLITVPDGNIVKLSFDKFELEPSATSTCTADYVEILEGKDRSNSDGKSYKGRYCGFTTPEDIHSSGRYMSVRFRSDSRYSNYVGFKATFKAVDETSKSEMFIISCHIIP